MVELEGTMGSPTTIGYWAAIHLDSSYYMLTWILGPTLRLYRSRQL